MDVTKSALTKARARVERLLQRHSGLPVTVLDDDDEEEEWNIADADALDELQIGYSVGTGGESLISDAPDSWRAEWLVIGYGDLLGDPLFVDLAQPDLPALSAAHGAGSWSPYPVAASLELLIFSEDDDASTE